MARVMDVAKRRLWSDRFRRFDRSDLTVVDFCLAEGVSTPSFYQWRRKLSGLGERAAAPDAGAPDTQIQEPTFFPVRLLSGKPTAAEVEIHLPNGARVIVTSADVPSMAAAIAAAGQVPREADRQEESEC
jgi:hypothetical protein